MKKLSVEWTRHLKSDKEKNELEVTLRNSRVTLGRLKEMLEEKRELSAAKSLTPSSFDDANWAYKQAYQNGYEYGLTQVLKLLEFIET